MDPLNLASGDNKNAVSRSSRYVDKDEGPSHDTDDKISNKDIKVVTTQTIEDNEMRLKERIAQCRNIIESLKFELNEEKSKLIKEKTTSDNVLIATEKVAVLSRSADLGREMSFDTNLYSACVESKLSCDENLMEYEKQLQKYENTLNMAQTEKKNAIRRQMLAKAYKLKLMEMENQCNIELLRVKQSLQCLEPLKVIASKWNTNTTTTEDYDYGSFELMLPQYPELSGNSCNDIATTLKQFETKPPPENSERGDDTKNDSAISDC